MQSEPNTQNQSICTLKLDEFPHNSHGKTYHAHVVIACTTLIIVSFCRPPDPVNEVMLGGNLNLTCVAVGSPMPFVKWRRGLDEDITPENELPVGKSVLELSDIRSSTNYTCIASSSLGVIEALAMVKVQCKFHVFAL